MLSAVSVTNPVFTPLHGWAVFGGSAGVTKVQVLSGLDRTWSYVADMYQQSSNERHCTMQLNDTTTVLIGGSGSRARSIVTFSWITLTHTLQPATLKKPRMLSSCAALKLNNGQTVAIIAGGYETGVEMWNPETGLVTLLMDVHPAEQSGSVGIQLARMLPIYGGSELLLFGGQLTGPQWSSAIWNYNGKFWRKIGDMPLPMSDFGITEITGFSCPY